MAAAVWRGEGQAVSKGEKIAELHLAAPDEGALARAAACFRIGDQGLAQADLVLERIG